MSAAVFSEPTEPTEAHPRLGQRTIKPEALAGRPDSGRRRISVLPAALRPGDVMRDCGVERTVERTNAGMIPVPDTVTVHFEHDPKHPQLPYETLAIPADVSVTAWRIG